MRISKGDAKHRLLEIRMRSELDSERAETLVDRRTALGKRLT